MLLSYEIRKFLKTKRSEDQIRKFRREQRMNLDGEHRNIPSYKFRKAG